MAVSSALCRRRAIQYLFVLGHRLGPFDDIDYRRGGDAAHPGVSHKWDFSLPKEASLVSGAGVMRTIGKIVVPLLKPIVGVVLLLGIVHSLQAFELELILAFPFRFYVFSTQIHFLLNQQLPQFAAATALGSTILFIMVPLIMVNAGALPGAAT